MSFTDPSLTFIALALFFGGVIFWLGWLQNTKGVVPFRPSTKAKNDMRIRIQRRLRKAGMVEATAGAFLYVIGTILAIIYIVVLLFTGSLWAGILLWPLVILMVMFYLNLRERSYIKRASVELVPFLRKIGSQVSSGRTAQAAFIETLEEAKLLRGALENSLIELRMNRSFGDVLKDTVEQLPMRSWAQFVRQMQMYEETGGDLAEIIADTVEQINSSIQLQAELRADYAAIAKQQWILIGIALGAVPFMKFVMGGLSDPLFTEAMGWAALGFSALMMTAGVVYGQSSVKDIERKLDF